MSSEKGHFKGRIIEINGSKITIDLTTETRYIIDKKTGERKLVGSAFPSPEIPKIGAVARVIFKESDLE